MSITRLVLLFVCQQALGGYVPPGPLYRCPEEPLLLHPCTCDQETDQGLWISCNNTNIASMSLALNNLATFEIPIENLLVNSCRMGRLYGSLLYKLKLRVLRIEQTPLETIDEFTFLGVNQTLNELHIINSSLKEFPSGAFKILGNLTTLNIDGHRIEELPKNAFFESDLNGKLLKLHLVNGLLSELPIEALQSLRKLRTLDLHGNALQNLRKSQFKGLRDVEVLDLSHNNIPKIDSSHLGDLTKLGWLNVSHNELQELTRGSFARNTVLKVLNMSHNRLKKLDSNSFRGMRFLRRLHLSDNAISDVGRGTFGALQRIGTIDLARNAIRKIDYQMFYQLNYIEVLDVSENSVTEIEKLAFKDIFLSAINLSRNNISKIDSGAFENCANITKLDLSFNQLRDLPKKAFDENTYATELQFSYNFFTSLDQIPLHNMTGLKILNVSHNRIESIPKKTFPKLYELHTIDLSYNNLTDIYNSVLQTLFSLRTLDLSHNSMQTLKPSTFGPLTTLLALDLSHNRLDNIAKSAFTRLQSTRELNLSHNKLNSLFILPISASNLDLSHNEFETLPAKLWPSMNSLLSLDLSFNRLGDSLDQGSFKNLLTLQRLNLSYNGMTRPPWAAISDLSTLQYLYVQVNLYKIKPAKKKSPRDLLSQFNSNGKTLEKRKFAFFGNNLTKLDRNAFGKMPVMFELDLSSNNIRNISARAFEGLLQLIRLKLDRNNLTTVPNGAFQGMVALTDLDISRNKLTKLDNKTNGPFEECLSLERLNLSHNKIAFVTRKMFPSNPWVPYKLQSIDLSYNSIPVLTYDLTFGTQKLEYLNISHNAVADIRKFVIGNLTRLKSLDLSHNALHDLTSDPEIFRLPENVSRLVLASNELQDLPWGLLKNASSLELLDLKENRLVNVSTEMIVKGTKIEYRGNPIHCDCFLRPLLRYLIGQLNVDPIYREIVCSSPPYLKGQRLHELSEEKLNCPSNINTTKILDNLDKEKFDVLPDLKFRALSFKKSVLKLKWRVMKPDDIADTSVFVRQVQNPANVVFQVTLPYYKRQLEIDIKEKLAMKELHDYQICILAKTSRSGFRKFYPEQCRDLDGSISAARAYLTSPEVRCTKNRMRIEIPLEPDTKRIYVQGLRDYPDPACRPHTDSTGRMAVLELDLDDVYRCAVTRVVNKQTGKKIYYQTLVVESATRETLHVKCSIAKEHLISRRQVFPAGFEEPIDLETTTSLIGMAPQPNITVGVRQSGKLVTGELNVSPGTPLQMEISLDPASTPIYGLLVTHMQVSDTKSQEETIIYNGCSADPYLFENFNTIDGDNLVAKFRAFKFPESTYVQFKGTVNVCLDRCKGVECSDGSVGYGRRKRAISSVPADPNKIFEITITSFIKVNYDDDAENFEEIIKNQTKMYNNKKLIVGNQMTDDVRIYRDDNGEHRLIKELKEEQKYTSIVAENASSPLQLYSPVCLVAALILMKNHFL
ncbi:unnamed protein product [Ceutorhynchus assimilis]|uniref:ZP domain-containing protein n=1 Tax=Ceutorhynchus assimilis TaxID=467358 RepID=A0A9P0DUR6_9CUCU|nr:unnamed protein product [Ceutorhynchus assimilis]